MDHIYSDRNEYFGRDKNGPCAFCEAQEKPDSFENLIVHRGVNNFVILNLYPYTSGHMMVVPYAHTNRLEQLSSEQISEMMHLIQKSIQILIKLYCPQGLMLVSILAMPVEQGSKNTCTGTSSLVGLGMPILLL